MSLLEMYRHQLQFLDKWLKDRRRKPLVIRGARQVGKSTLVELFAKVCKKMGGWFLQGHMEDDRKSMIGGIAGETVGVYGKVLSFKC